jgi:hypothetical protein
VLRSEWLAAGFKKETGMAKKKAAKPKKTAKKAPARKKPKKTKKGTGFC